MKSPPPWPSAIGNAFPSLSDVTTYLSAYGGVSLVDNPPQGTHKGYPYAAVVKRGLNRPHDPCEFIDCWRLPGEYRPPDFTQPARHGHHRRVLCGGAGNWNVPEELRHQRRGLLHGGPGDDRMGSGLKFHLRQPRRHR